MFFKMFSVEDVNVMLCFFIFVLELLWGLNIIVVWFKMEKGKILLEIVFWKMKGVIYGIELDY